MVLLYENYVNKLKEEFNSKIEIIDYYISFIEKYNLEFLMLFIENNDITLEIIHKYSTNYRLECSGCRKKINSFMGTMTIFDTTMDNSVFNLLKNHMKDFNIQDVIDSMYSFSELFSVLKSTDEKIDLKYILMNWETDDDNIKIFNDSEFQDILLSKQSENFYYFFEILEEDDAKLDEKVREKYIDLYNKYLKQKKSKTFNL